MRRETGDQGVSGCSFSERRVRLLGSIMGIGASIVDDVDLGLATLAPLDVHADGTPIKTRDKVYVMGAEDGERYGLRYDTILGKITGVVIDSAEGRQTHLFSAIPANPHARDAEERLAAIEAAWNNAVSAGVEDQRGSAVVA